ncbi:MAG: hypothetical protein ABJH68_03265 [Ilumatobacter sp.]
MVLPAGLMATMAVGIPSDAEFDRRNDAELAGILSSGPVERESV